jgi:hypothetical protein
VQLDRDAVRLEIPGDNADCLGSDAALEQPQDAAGDLPHLRVQTRSRERLQAGRGGAHGGRLPRGHALQALAEALRKRPARRKPLRRGGIRRRVEDHDAAKAAHERLDQVRGDAGGVCETVDQDRPARQGALGIVPERFGRLPEHNRCDTDTHFLQRGGDLAGDPQQGAGTARSRIGPGELGETLVEHLDVCRHDAGVEEVAHGCDHRREPVVEGVDQSIQRPLSACRARDQHRQHVTARERRSAGTVQNLQRETL